MKIKSPQNSNPLNKRKSSLPQEMNGCLSPPSATHSFLLPPTGRIPSPPNPIVSSASPPDSYSSTRRSLLLNLAIFAPYAVVSKQPCFAAEGYDPVTEVEKKASSSIAKRINVAVGLLDKGRELQAKGDFVGALDYFTQVSYISTIRSFSLGFLVSDLMLVDIF